MANKTDRIILREAILDDAPMLARLMGVLGYPTTEAAMRDRLVAIGADADYYAIVAEFDGEVRGFAGLRRGLYFEADGTFVQLTALVVDDGFQGQGIGTALTEAAESWARAIGARAISLTSGHQRHAAHHFYERQGYRSTGVRFVKRLAEYE